MTVGMYFLFGYLIIINIVTLVVYANEAGDPSSRISALLLIVLPIIGGSAGAVIANYFSDVEFRELRRWLSKFLGYLPPIMFIIQFIMLVSAIGVDNCVSFVWTHAHEQAGVIGCILVVLNCLSFILVVIRRSAVYIAPDGNFLIPDIILIPLLILGGATGGMLAKILFNFKEDWSGNATMEFQNFMYNWGIFITSIIHVGIYIYFFIIR